MIIADTSGLLALYNRAEPNHAKVARFVGRTDEPLVVSPYVIAELDYLVATRIGVQAELEVLRELTSGAYEIACIGSEELATTIDVIDKYRDQDIGIADASLVVLAHLRGSRTILTLDSRHFTVLRPLSGGRFKLVPT